MNTLERAQVETARDRARAVWEGLEAALASSSPSPQQPAPATPAAPVSAPSGGLQSPALFFNAVRGTLWPRLRTEQVEGCETILAACAGTLPLTWTAYALATTYHETGYTMQPIRERGGDAYLDKYDTGRLAAALGNTPQDDGDGVLYAGRCYVQLTGRRNYRLAGEKLGVPLLEQPDLALKPDIAAKILVRGMLEGWFTGKKLNDFIPIKAERAHYRNARRIINGTDRADDIAGYALSFDGALHKGGWR